MKSDYTTNHGRSIRRGGFLGFLLDLGIYVRQSTHLAVTRAADNAADSYGVHPTRISQWQ